MYSCLLVARNLPRCSRRLNRRWKFVGIPNAQAKVDMQRRHILDDEIEQLPRFLIGSEFLNRVHKAITTKSHEQ